MGADFLPRAKQFVNVALPVADMNAASGRAEEFSGALEIFQPADAFLLLNRNACRCRRGQRLIGKAPFGHWKTTTFTAGLRCDGLVAPWVLDGPMDGEAFLIYVETVLASSLPDGDIVVIDNLSAHKVDGVQAAIEARGAKLLYLPPYSPDLNPIEMASAKIKTLLRKAAARTRGSLWDKLAEILVAFTPHECANYVAHSGYASS